MSSHEVCRKWRRLGLVSFGGHQEQAKHTARLGGYRPAHADPDERVLIVAPSNVAVDAVLAELINALECSEQGKRLLRDRLVLRYGRPQGREDQFSPRAVWARGPRRALNRNRRGTELHVRRLTQKRSPEPEIAEAKTRLRQLQSQRKARISEHVRRRQGSLQPP